MWYITIKKQKKYWVIKERETSQITSGMTLMQLVKWTYLIQWMLSIWICIRLFSSLSFRILSLNGDFFQYTCHYGWKLATAVLDIPFMFKAERKKWAILRYICFFLLGSKTSPNYTSQKIILLHFFFQAV